MRIEFDEFEIEIRPKERGASFLETLSKIFEMESFQNLLEKIANMAESMAVQKLSDEPTTAATTYTDAQLADLHELIIELKGDTELKSNATVIRLVSQYSNAVTALLESIAQYGEHVVFTMTNATCTALYIDTGGITVERFAELIDAAATLTPAAAEEI